MLTKPEILQKIEAYLQTKLNNMSGDELLEGPFEGDQEAYDHATEVIDGNGGLGLLVFYKAPRS